MRIFLTLFLLYCIKNTTFSESEKGYPYHGLDFRFQEQVIEWLGVWLPLLGREDFQIRGILQAPGEHHLTIEVQFEGEVRARTLSWLTGNSPLEILPFMSLIAGERGVESLPSTEGLTKPDYAECGEIRKVFTDECRLPLQASEVLPYERTSDGQALLGRMYLNLVQMNQARDPLSLDPLLARGVAHWILSLAMSAEYKEEEPRLGAQVEKLLDSRVAVSFPHKTDELADIRNSVYGWEGKSPDRRDLEIPAFEENLNRLKAIFSFAMTEDLGRFYRHPWWKLEASSMAKWLRDKGLKAAQDPVSVLDRLLVMAQSNLPVLVGKGKVRRLEPSLIARLAYNSIAELEYRRIQGLKKLGFSHQKEIALQKGLKTYAGKIHAFILREDFPETAVSEVEKLCIRDFSLCSPDTLYFAWQNKSLLDSSGDFQASIGAYFYPYDVPRPDHHPARLAMGDFFQRLENPEWMLDAGSFHEILRLGSRLGFNRAVEHYLFRLNPKKYDYLRRLRFSDNLYEDACGLAELALSMKQIIAAENILLEYREPEPKMALCYGNLWSRLGDVKRAEIYSRQGIAAPPSSEVKLARARLAGLLIREKKHEEGLKILASDWEKPSFEGLLAARNLAHVKGEELLAKAIGIYAYCRNNFEGFTAEQCPKSLQKALNTTGTTWDYAFQDQTFSVFRCDDIRVASALEAWQQCGQDFPVGFYDRKGNLVSRFETREEFFDALLQTEPLGGVVEQSEKKSGLLFLFDSGGIMRDENFRVLHTGPLLMNKKPAFALSQELFWALENSGE